MRQIPIHFFAIMGAVVAKMAIGVLWYSPAYDGPECLMPTGDLPWRIEHRSAIHPVAPLLSAPAPGKRQNKTPCCKAEKEALVLETAWLARWREW